LLASADARLVACHDASQGAGRHAGSCRSSHRTSGTVPPSWQVAWTVAAAGPVRPLRSPGPTIGAEHGRARGEPTATRVLAR